jgi:1-acyl-sn-glycerol-3-phosphate acyltransferase
MSRAHKPKAGLWIRLCVLVVYPLVGRLFKLRWLHLERIPADGGVIIAINHISQIDTLATARMVWESGRIPRFLIKSTVFTVPVVGSILTNARQIPVFRGTADAIQSLSAAREAIDRGECVIIYPEGTVTQDLDYWPMQAKTGIARLALALPDVPVIPVGQWGAHRTLARGGSFRPFPRKSHQASVGQPVDLSRFWDLPVSSSVLHDATEEIMRAITTEVAGLRAEAPPLQATAWAPSQHRRSNRAGRNPVALLSRRRNR